jgi:hypothetical protein
VTAGYELPEVGEHVQVSPPGSGGGIVLAVGPVNVKLLSLVDGSEVYVPHERIDRINLRCGAPLVVVPCSSKKLDRPAPARDLYVGSYHRAARRTACRFTVPSHVRILSGLHGFVDPGQVLAPYEQRIDQPGAVSMNTLRAQAAELPTYRTAGQHGDFDGRELRPIILAGAAYAERCLEIWPDAWWPDPLRNARGIGDHLAWFAKLAPFNGRAVQPRLVAS